MKNELAELNEKYLAKVEENERVLADISIQSNAQVKAAESEELKQLEAIGKSILLETEF